MRNAAKSAMAKLRVQPDHVSTCITHFACWYELPKLAFINIKKDGDWNYGSLREGLAPEDDKMIREAGSVLSHCGVHFISKIKCVFSDTLRLGFSRSIGDVV